MEVEIKKSRWEAFKSFVKKNIYYILIGLAVITLAVVLAITTTVGGKQNTEVVPPGPDEPTNTDTIEIVAPLENIELLKDYSGTDLMYNATLKQWEAHKAIDFKAEDGTNVLAIADGTVDQVYKNYTYGTVIVISHTDGLKSVYSSLNEETNVKAGDTVTAGAVIGTVGKTANNEFVDQAHLRFELYKDNILVDPNEYISLSDK